MKVIVPFAIPCHTGVQPWALAATRLALIQDGIDPSFELMKEGDSYYKLMCELWAAGESFTTVEHDIVVWPSAIEQLEQCKEPWCVYPYYCSVGWIIDGLGCTKFEGSFIKKHPNFLKEPFPTCCNHTTYYCGLDRLIAHRMQDLGIKPHIHTPGVVNLNDKWTI